MFKYCSSFEYIFLCSVDISIQPLMFHLCTYFAYGIPGEQLL